LNVVGALMNMPNMWMKCFTNASAIESLKNTIKSSKMNDYQSKMGIINTKKIIHTKNGITQNYKGI
jgi:hypothetical protein